jgi:hypothetical protein
MIITKPAFSHKKTEIIGQIDHLLLTYFPLFCPPEDLTLRIWGEIHVSERIIPLSGKSLYLSLRKKVE